MPQNYIGTSGFSYPHWRKRFYPKALREKEHLSFYAEHFDTVEVNGSFYHLLAKSTVKGWLKAVPKDFTFAVKGSRFTTHNKKLSDPKKSSAKFFKSIEPFGKRLGPIL